MKREFLFFILLVLGSCSSDNGNGAEQDDTPQNVLTQEELRFIEEYRYVTFNLSPTSFGGDLNEKWSGEVKIFLDGDTDSEYVQAVEDRISDINDYLTDGTSINLASTVQEAGIHLYLGPAEDLQNLWTDMYELVSQGDFSGYALYSSNSTSNINFGRIWVRTDGMPIFTHELGHILGLGHASNTYCGQNSGTRSFMCSGLSSGFSSFDIGIIKTLYHPEITVGKNFSQLRPSIEGLLLSGAIKL